MDDLTTMKNKALIPGHRENCRCQECLTKRALRKSAQREQRKKDNEKYDTKSSDRPRYGQETFR